MKNPVVNGWYADPESRLYNDTVYMYVTNSLPFEEQKNLDLVITDALENFRVVRGILDMSTYKGAYKAIWAPTVIDKDGKRNKGMKLAFDPEHMSFRYYRRVDSAPAPEQGPTLSDLAEDEGGDLPF